jgi:hypothetical protein
MPSIPPIPANFNPSVGAPGSLLPAASAGRASSVRAGGGTFPVGAARQGRFIQYIGNNSETVPAGGLSSASLDRLLAADAAERKRDRRNRIAVEKAYRALGLDQAARDLHWCKVRQGFRHSECGGMAYKLAEGVQSCDDPCCTYCLRERAGRLAADWTPIVERFKAPAHLMLSSRRKPGQSLVDAAADFEHALRKFMKSEEFKKHVPAWIGSLEVAYSWSGWGVHGHFLVDCRYWNVKAISALWLHCTGDAPVVWITRVRPGVGRGLAGAIQEVIKYPCKLGSFVDNPALVGEYRAWKHGKRLFRSGGACLGALRRAREAAALEAGQSLGEYDQAEKDRVRDLVIEKAKSGRICPHCGGVGLVKLSGNLRAPYELVAIGDTGVWFVPAPADPVPLGVPPGA